MEKIISKNCDYVICLKGNQESLHEDVKLYFDTAEKEPNFYPLVKTHNVSKDHGRIEKRYYYLTDDVNWINSRDEWVGLNAIGVVHSVRIVNGVETSENRYKTMNVPKMSLKLKRFRCSFDDNFLYQVIFNNFLI